jgi:hypothetical protein
VSKYYVAFKDEGKLTLSSREFEDRKGAARYASTISPTREPLILQIPAWPLRGEACKEAFVRKELMTVERFDYIEGVAICEVSCNDYEEYKLLPQVIEISEKVLGKSCWNSDCNKAYYRNDKLFARKQ